MRPTVLWLKLELLRFVSGKFKSYYFVAVAVKSARRPDEQTDRQTEPTNGNEHHKQLILADLLIVIVFVCVCQFACLPGRFFIIQFPVAPGEKERKRDNRQTDRQLSRVHWVACLIYFCVFGGNMSDFRYNLLLFRVVGLQRQLR